MVKRDRGYLCLVKPLNIGLEFRLSHLYRMQAINYLDIYETEIEWNFIEWFVNIRKLRASSLDHW